MRKTGLRWFSLVRFPRHAGTNWSDNAQPQSHRHKLGSGQCGKIKYTVIILRDRFFVSHVTPHLLCLQYQVNSDAILAASLLLS
jgi:hypothetical protein